MPWQPNASSASSIFNFPFNREMVPQQIGLTSAPMIIADQIGTNPAPGVIATNPTTRPVEAPTRVGFPSLITSINIQDIMALALASAVVINACAASPFAANALPALNPNHPNHKINAPSATNGMLCTRYAVCSYPLRLPRIMENTSALTPELICTTFPPAKSTDPISARNPPCPHTMCAIG